MDLEMDGGKVLYGLGAFLGIISVLYFGSEIILSLSPLTKSVLLFGTFAVFLLVAVRMSGSLLTTTLYVLSAASYVIFLGYTIFRFDIGTNGTFLFLAASSALFIGLGYTIREQGRRPSKKHVRAAVAFIIAVAAILVAIDVLGPHPVYTFQAAATVTAGERVSRTVGAVTAENPFVLPRTVDLPEYEACRYTQDGRERVHISQTTHDTGLLWGGQSRTHNMTAHLPIEVQEGEPVTQEYTVQHADRCPDSAAENTLYIVRRPTPPA